MASEAQSEDEIPLDDGKLIEQADKDIAEERWLVAARLLRKVKDKSALTEKHTRILTKAEQVERIVPALMSEPGDEWTKQGETHGKFDTIIYYKVVDSKLTARIETPIEQSLLVPLLSVFNETDLYTTWLPRWERPVKLGVRKCAKLRQDGRCNQMLMATTDIPWPLAARECLIDIVAIDEIDTSGAIIVKMDTGDYDDPVVPEVEKGAVRIYYDGTLLFRKCPDDHPAFAKSKHTHGSDMVLICLELFVDPKVKYVPQSMINFATRTALGGMWHGTLTVAEEVRDGKRPVHADAIEKKRDELYDWLDQRINALLSSMKQGPDGLSAEQD